MCQLLLTIVSLLVASMAILTGERPIPEQGSELAPSPHVARKQEPVVWKLEPLPDGKRVGSTPVTMKAKKDDSLNALLAQISEDPKANLSLRIRLVGMEPTDSKAVIKVFVNSPESDPTPKGESAYLVGTISSYGKKERGDYVLDLAPPLRKLHERKLWGPRDSLIIRLVYAAANPKRPIDDASVGFENVRLESDVMR